MKISILFSFLILFIPALLPAQDNTFQLSSHILDISKGLPAVDVNIKLEKMNETGHWIFVDERKTDQHGRVKDFLEQKPDSVNAGIYQLTYQVKPYFEANQLESFYPFIVVVFEIKDNNHYHVPITLSPFGYSTYRGN